MYCKYHKYHKKQRNIQNKKLINFSLQLLNLNSSFNVSPHLLFKSSYYMYFCLHTNSFCVNFKYMYDKNKKKYYMQFTQSRILSFLLKPIYFANFKLKNYSSIWYFNAFWFFNTIFNKYNMYLIITLTNVVKLAICIYMVKNTNKSIYNILSYIIKFCFTSVIMSERCI